MGRCYPMENLAHLPTSNAAEAPITSATSPASPREVSVESPSADYGEQLRGLLQEVSQIKQAPPELRRLWETPQPDAGFAAPPAPAVDPPPDQRGEPEEDEVIDATGDDRPIPELSLIHI